MAEEQLCQRVVAELARVKERMAALERIGEAANQRIDDLELIVSEEIVRQHPGYYREIVAELGAGWRIERGVGESDLRIGERGRGGERGSGRGGERERGRGGDGDGRFVHSPGYPADEG